MRVVLGSDHAGFDLKQTLTVFLRGLGQEVLDVGTNNNAPVDYPDYAEAVGKAVRNGEAERGILICGSGVGASVAANKLPGIRAGVCHDTYSAHQGVEHDDINVLVLGARVVGPALAKELATTFLRATFSGEERHRRRLKKVRLMEARYRATQRQVDRQSFHLGTIQAKLDERLLAWEKKDFTRSLWAKDYTLWSAQPAPEITNRLGWLTSPEAMQEHIAEFADFAKQVRDDGLRHVVLLGMGGSSLAPEVFVRTFGNAPGYPELLVLDSTHPAAVRATEAKVDLAHTLFLVSSKSGTTLEMLSFFHYFWKRIGEKSPRPGQHFAAITDPATPLETLARERKFRRFFSATPDVGGRYSALTAFGLAPAALIGVDEHRLLDRAGAMAEACTSRVRTTQNPGLALGAALGELALAGRNKVTFHASPGLESFPAWLEQLIAESTGKNGKGIIPVADETLGPPENYGTDRVFVRIDSASDGVGGEDPGFRALEAAGHPSLLIRLTEKADLGGEFFRWEVAIAAAGAVLGINPFDQPDVELAKDLARKAMAKGTSGSGASVPTVSTSKPEELAQAVVNWMREAKLGSYIAIQAYLSPTPETTSHLQNLRSVMRNRSSLATTLGYGPRFLHSTGQLHKGGPNTGLFLQLVDDPADDLPVPETDFSFGALIRAQALGDYLALVQRGRHVLRVNLGHDVKDGLSHIAAIIDSSFHA